MAVTIIANQIRSGQIEIGLAVGVESMSEKYSLDVARIPLCSPFLQPGQGWTSSKRTHLY